MRNGNDGGAEFRQREESARHHGIGQCDARCHAQSSGRGAQHVRAGRQRARKPTNLLIFLSGAIADTEQRRERLTRQRATLLLPWVIRRAAR
jgi:hypothetical protein